MRIAMLSDDWWPVTGGGPTHVKALAIALAENFGDEIDVYTRKLKDEDGRAYTENEQYANGKVNVVRLGPTTEYWNPVGRVTSMATPIPKLLANDYDVIHGHTYLPAVPLRVASALTGTPSVFTVHGMPLTSDVAGNQSIADRIREWAISRLVLDFEYDSVISVNRTNVDLLAAHHDDVAYVPNGVDVERFRPDAAQNERKILYLGRLDPQKRVGDLIAAFEGIADEFPDVELVVVGTGRMEDDLRQRAARSPVADRIRFTGKVPDAEVPRQYASAELFVLPSHWEGHPLSLLEAWASGTPAIATDVEGIREFVEHGENGYLVEPKSPESLAAGLRHALSHPERAAEWGQAGRETVLREFTWERCAERTRAIYEAVSDRATLDAAERVAPDPTARTK